jgi:hypothetical protein
MRSILHDFHQARGDLFPCQQGLDELVPEQLDDADRIGAGDGDKRALGRNETVGDQAMRLRMKPGRIIPVALQGRHHAGKRVAILGGFLEEILRGPAGDGTAARSSGAAALRGLALSRGLCRRGPRRRILPENAHGPFRGGSPLLGPARLGFRGQGGHLLLRSGGSPVGDQFQVDNEGWWQKALPN